MGEYGLMQCVRPALLLRKPIEKGLSIAQNVLKHGAGALNIDACRFGYSDPCWVQTTPMSKRSSDGAGTKENAVFGWKNRTQDNPLSDDFIRYHSKGRHPANLYQCSDDDTNLLNIIDNTHEESNMTKDLWADMPSAKILHGDCMELLRSLPDNSIDAIVTDPPYGMSGDGIMRTWADLEEGHNVKGFMGKSWDSAVPCHNFFAECLRVIKHGGHMIAFSSTRTVCALGMAAQRGGWRVRDMLHWCYFSGFPKSHSIDKAIDREAGAVRDKQMIQTKPSNRKDQEGMLSLGANGFTDISKPVTQDAQRWDGFGTALKPAVEPALLLRKPLEKGLTIAQNVLKHGTGALNIDACRFAFGDSCWVGDTEIWEPMDRGPSGKGSNVGPEIYGYKGAKINTPNNKGRWPANLYQCPKASRSEREEGLGHLQSKTRSDLTGRKEGSAGLEGSYGDGNNPYSGANYKQPIHNIHPTVKPLKLMRWCCRLIGGQKGSTILDPFAGSGTTLMAGILEGFDVVGMEMTDDYLSIIEGRVRWAKEQYKRENAQLSLFGDLK